MNAAPLSFASACMVCKFERALTMQGAHGGACIGQTTLTLASIVLPLPGLPYSRMPRGGFSRVLRNSSGRCKGRTTSPYCQE